MQQGIQVADMGSDVFVDRRTKVWLECNGESYDFRSVKNVRIRNIAEGIEMVHFTCPRCGKRHQSLRFA